MMKMKKITAFVLAAVTAASLILTGCHGSKGQQAFAIPEEFDTSRDYEITFWAKNDTNKAQTAVYEKAIEDLLQMYRIKKVK